MALARKITIGVRGETTTEMIEQTLGFERWTKLRQCFGGLDIFIPATPSDDHPLVRRLGREDAEFLCSNFPGMRFSVPMPGDSAERKKQRNQEKVRRALADGLSQHEMALELGCTQRHVRRIIARMGEAGKAIPTVRPPNAKKSAIEQLDSRIQGFPPASLRRWESIIRLDFAREITRTVAVNRLGVSTYSYAVLAQRLRQTGTILPATAPDQPPPAASSPSAQTLNPNSRQVRPAVPERRKSGSISHLF